MPLDTMAELADRIVEVAPPTLPDIAHAVFAAPAIDAVASAPSDVTAQLAAQVQELSRPVTALQVQLSQHNMGQRYRSGSGPRTDRETICYFHRRFSNRAKRCTTLCKLSENNAGSPQ